MPTARIAVAGTLGLALALGIWSVAAILRTASRRVGLADALAIRVPEVRGARVLSTWKPVADADLAHMELCFDDADTAEACAQFAAALRGTRWRASEIASVPSARRAVLTADDGVYRLRALAQPGSRVGCDAARRQALLSIEAAPIR